MYCISSTTEARNETARGLHGRLPGGPVHQAHTLARVAGHEAATEAAAEGPEPKHRRTGQQPRRPILPGGLTLSPEDKKSTKRSY